MIQLRINRHNDDSHRCWLVGHPAMSEREWSLATNLRVEVVRTQQADSGAGWEEKSFTDKKNQHVTTSAQGTRNFLSAIACWRWKNLLRGPAATQPHPWSGDVIERHLLPDATFEEVKYPNAVISMDPLLGHGASQAIGYTVKAGHAEPFRTGVRCTMTVPGALALASMRFYGENASPASDGIIDLAWAFPANVPAVGSVFRFELGEHYQGAGTSTVFNVVVVSPSDPNVGTAQPEGFLAPYPLHENLSAVATWMDSLTDVAASYVAGSRPHILVSWAGDSDDGLAVTYAEVTGSDVSDVVCYTAHTVGATALTLVIGSSTLMVDEAT